MKLTALVWDDSKAYFFDDAWYVRYSIGDDRAAPNYPRMIEGNWKGFPKAFLAGVDAAVKWNNGFAYFFKGDSYIKYNMDAAKEGVEPNYPRKIEGNWKGFPKAFLAGVDAAVTWNNGFAYFFKGDSYVKYNMDRAKEGVEPNYPRKIEGNWKGFPKAFLAGIDAGVVWPNGFAYFFKGDKYVKYNIDPANEGVMPDYPRPIKGNWCGLFGKSFGEPEVVIHYSQVANFPKFDETPGDPNPFHPTINSFDGMFIIYRIDSIDNNTPLFGGVNFDFKLANLFATKRDEQSGNPGLDKFLKSAPDQKTIPSGKSASGLGTIVIRVAGAPLSLMTAVAPLHYCAPGINVSMARNSPKSVPQFIDLMSVGLATEIKNG